MLQVNRVSKRFGHHQVLREVTFNLNDGDHVALIGENGSGKTTLLEVIAGTLPADSGSMVVSSGQQIGYLPQNPASIFATTIAEAMLAAVNQSSAWNKSELSPREKAESLRLLAALGLSHLDLDTDIATLSGGEATRVQLASLLLQDPDILLLDEPTNHLDIQALEWLEGFINHFKGTVLLISHDRLFLDRTIQAVYELDGNKPGIRKIPGNYANYSALLAFEKQKSYETWKDQEAEIRRLKADWVNTAEQARFSENSTKDSKMRRYAKKVAKKGTAKKKRLERYLESPDRIEKPMDRWRININFAEPEHQSQQILSVEALSFAYGARPILDDLKLYISAGDRVALVGANGSGKSTLLKLLVNELPIQHGRLRWGNSVVLGYMPQQQENLDAKRTPIELIQNIKGMSLSETYHFLHYFLLDEHHATLPVSALSFGQRSRLILAQLVAQGANFLVLDEPVNHLDIPSREQFEKALDAFNGGMLLVAHDRAFIARTCNKLWKLTDGSIRSSVPPQEWDQMDL